MIEDLARVKLLETYLPRDARYVAVSYSWEASPYEDEAAGRYTIVNLRTGRSRPSVVRDEVLSRVLAYAVYKKLLKFWIDRECIEQDYLTPTERKRKEQAI